MPFVSRWSHPVRLSIWEVLLALLLVSVVYSPAASDSNSCPHACGNISIPFPFSIAAGDCGLPDFSLKCAQTSADRPSRLFNGSGKAGPLFPFLSTSSGPFQVLSIGSASLVINVTDLKAVSCDGPDQAHGTATFALEQGSPYALSAENKFFVNGCNSSGNVTTDVSNGTASCVTSCVNTPVPNYPFCNIYDCCVSSLPAGSRVVVMHGGGIQFKGGGCRFASIVYPPSFLSTDVYTIETGQYGLELSYAIKGSCDDSEAQAA